MFLSDLLMVALKQVYRNKRRYRSVLFGIALGIAGFVVILTMGDSVETDLGKNLELLGSATLIKAEWDFQRSPRWHHGQYYLEDIDNLRKIPMVRSVSPAVFKSDQVFSYNGRKFTGRLIGVEENFFDTVYIPTSVGRRIRDEDVNLRRSVCVVGTKVLEALMKDVENPIGKSIGIGGNIFTVIGVIGGVEDVSFMETVLIPFSVARARFENMYEIRNIYIRAANWNVVSDLHLQVLNFLKSSHPGYADAIYVRSYPERIKTIQNTVLMVKIFLYAALGVTLILGGLGISSVMLSAVRERTTEIGLRKAVGATEPMIMMQFLLEAVLISFLGTIFGIVVGTISVEVLKEVFGTAPDYRIFVISVVSGVLFSCFLGIISGFVPAKRASRLDPAEAMRFE